MGFIKWRVAPGGGARRSLKLWRLRLMKAGMVAAVAVVAAGGGVYLWKSGAPAKIKSFASAETLRLSAEAGFHVNDIRVAGLVHLTDDELRARLNIEKGDPVFGFDIATEQKNIESLPWVKSASILRRLPGTVMIRVTSARPSRCGNINSKSR